MTGQIDLFGDGSGDIFEAKDYGRFSSLLRASGCARCALSGGRTQIVVDRGNPAAGIMAIGEGPGEQEDLLGKAFVGRAGQLLDRLLTGVGLETDRDLLIANVVKCRPPGNRAPRREEAEACLPYLQRQIELVAPHTILLLGATAVRHLFPEKKTFTMKSEAGKIFTAPNFPAIDFMILYHPAYLLRDPRKQPGFLTHIETLKKHLSPLNRWPT
ncbi:uracil-DNA glycosylase [Candidatus Moduliflexota bacterium]